MSELHNILRDPSAEFSSPHEVLRAQQLSRNDKVRVLRQWRYDLVQLQVASAESLTGDTDSTAGIRTIDECLRQLNFDEVETA